MATESIDIRIREDGARVVNRRIEDIGNKAEESADKMDLLRNALAAIGTYLALDKLRQYADTWSMVSGAIRIATKSQEEAIAVQNELFKVAQKTRQDLTSTTELYARLARSGKELGVSQQDLINFTENVGKTLAASGTNADQASGALLQLGQALGGGVVRAEEFNSIIEGAPAILQVVANNLDGANGSIGRLRNIMLEGKLTSKAFFDAFQKGGDQIDKDFKKASFTIGQGMTVLDNAMTRYIGRMDESIGISSAFGRSAVFIADNLDQIMNALLAVGAAVAIAFAPAVIAKFAVAIKGLWLLIAANPVVAVVAAVAALIVVSDDARAAFIKFGKDVLMTVDAVTGLLTGVYMSMVRAFDGLPAVIKNSMKMAFNWVVEIMDKIVNAAITGINKIRDFVGKEPIQLIDTNKFTDVDENFGKNYLASIQGGIDEGFRMQGGLVSKTVDNLLTSMGNELDKQKGKLSGKVDLTQLLGTGSGPGADLKETEKQRKALEKAKKEELALMKKQQEEFKSVVNDLQSNTEAIDAAYAKRREIIIKNTEANSRAQQKLLEANQAARDQELAQLREFEIQRIGVGITDNDAQLEAIRAQYEERMLLIQESETLTFNEKVSAANNAYLQLEELQRQHFERMHAEALSFGHGQVNEYSQMFKALQQTQDMSMGNQLLTYTGVLQSMTAEGAKHSKKMFELNKKASMANVIVSTAMGAAKALEWGWPMGPIFAGMIIANGMAQLKTIRGQSFQGGAGGMSGSTTAPTGAYNSTGSTVPTNGGSQLPTTNTAQNTQQQAPVTIIINGNVSGTDGQRVFEELKEIIGRGDQILIETTSANGMLLNNRVA